MDPIRASDGGIRVGELEQSLLNPEVGISDMAKDPKKPGKLRRLLGAAGLSVGLATAPTAYSDGIGDAATHVAALTNPVEEESQQSKKWSLSPSYIASVRDMVPAGVLNSRDPALTPIYLAATGKGKPLNDLRSRFSGEWAHADGISISPETLYIDPAVYYVQITTRRSSGGISNLAPRDLAEKNPALDQFRRGFVDFNTRYGYKSSSATIPEIEGHFIRSIFHAAYQNNEQALTKAQEYLDGDVSEREKLIGAVQKIISSMRRSSDSSTDPNDTDNRLRVAAWSSMMLTNHYLFNGAKDMGKLSAGIEKQIGKDKGIIIRGRVNYVNDNV